MTDGFITKKPKSEGKSLTCVSCGLYKDCKSPRMIPFGNFKRGIMNIGEAPGEIEDDRGKPWQGKMGVFLKNAYDDLGINLFDDCININALRCRPTDNRKNNRAPKNSELNCCRQYVLKNIIKYQPKVIVLFGNSPLISVIGHRWKRDLGTITKWRGWTIPDQEYNAWVCPMFHPSFVGRSEEERAYEVNTVWLQDLKQAISLVDTPLPTYQEPNITILDKLSPLTKIREVFAIDYETTGLKPHADGHRIICCGIATDPDNVYVFMIPQTKAERKPLVDLLADPHVAKMAHNIKFEDAWSTVRLRQPVQNWVWDSMLAAHILDNRRSITNLKFQVYVHFGIADYASDVDPYIKPKGKANGNAFNQLTELLSKPNGKETLLKYCALDAVYEYRLAMLQRNLIKLPF